MPARIQRGQHAAGRAVQCVIVTLLDAAQSIVVGAHIAQDLRGRDVVGVVPLELFLDVNALQVQGLVCLAEQANLRLKGADGASILAQSWSLAGMLPLCGSL